MSRNDIRDPLHDLTVVIPVWNDYVDYLPDCLAALPSGVRVIVVDNASARPLPTVPAASAVLRLDDRRSAGFARNAGLALVETEFVGFLDADDVPLPGALHVLAQSLHLERRAVAAFGRLMSWDPATGARVLSARLPRPITIRASRHQRLFAIGNVALNTFPIAGGVLRTEVVKRVGGYGDADVGEDWILGAALCFQGRVLLVDEPTMLRRIHHGSLWYREHSREALRQRTKALRSRLRNASTVPWYGKLAVRMAVPAHELMTVLTSRSGTHEPLPPTVVAS